MHISLNWLKDYVNIPKDLSPDTLAKLLTLKTAEIESVLTEGQGLDGVVVGEIIEITKHPNADKLSVAKVDIGRTKPIQLCFGQMVKMEIGFRIPVAVAPTKLPTGAEILKKDLRGVISEGMLCLDQEMGLKKEGISIQFFPKSVKPGTPLTALLGLEDTILEFDNKSLTHRPDLWGHYGIAREIAAITDQKLKPYKTDQKFPATKSRLKIIVDDTVLCPRFAACLISNVKIGPSPDWLIKRLKSAGMRSVNNIVDVTNYVMMDLGQPMHAYDRDIVKTDTLKVELARKNQTIETIDHKRRTLHEQDMLVTDGKGTFLDLAGIMGGAHSEINDNTTNIILEAANWNPSLLRQTSVRQSLRSDASQRFEKAQDPENCPIAIKKAAELILKMCPQAKLEGNLVDIHSPKKPLPKITLRIQRAQSKIGIKITKPEATKILKSLEFKVTAGPKDTLKIEVPSFRATKDISIEDDLIEELARMYGYDEIPALLPHLPTRLPIENEERFTEHEIRKFLAYGLGLDEISTYSFYSKQDFANAGLKEEGHILIENFLSEDQTHMRFSLAPNLLKKLALNSKYQENFQVFEIGRTYKDLKDFFPLEEKWITGAFVRTNKKSKPFYEAKEAAEQTLKHLQIPYYKLVKSCALPYANPAKSATIISAEGETLGSILALHPQIAKNFGLEKLDIALFELNFSLLSKFPKQPRKFTELPKFPPIKIDVSVLVDKTKPIAEIADTIQKSDQHLITSVELFDLYEGENLGKGKKSVAFKVTLQSQDKTLTDTEMSQTQKKIFENLQKLGGQIRGL